MKFKKVLKSKKFIFVVVAVLLVLAVIVISNSRSTTQETITTEKVKTDNISLLVSASGNIIAKSTYSITSKVTSKAVEVDTVVGAHVKAGNVLIKFDDTDLQNASKIALYNFNAAIYKRDQVKATPNIDQNSINAAQQQVNVTYTQWQSAKNAINNATITSPIDGEILAVNIKVNEYPSLTIPAVIVADTSKFEAIIGINEIDINKIQIGQHASLSIEAVSGTLGGTVIEIDNNGINTLGIVTYQVHIQPDSFTGLKPNMSVDADIIILQKDNVLVVPAAAIQVINGKSYVRVLNNITDPSSKAIQTEVGVGISNNTLTEITSGVSEGQNVIINIVNSGASSIFNFGSSK